MSYWAVVISPADYEHERLFASQAVALPGVGPSVGDGAVLVAEGEPPVVFGLGTVRSATDSAHGLEIAYQRRLFDHPLPAADFGIFGQGADVLDKVRFDAIVARAASAADLAPARRSWLVSVDLPIEADSPAEAVRVFWNYLYELGPRELPAFVSPSSDELSMQVFVLGDKVDLDPEQDQID